jgi:transposase
MTRFVVGEDRGQSTLFPERLDHYLAEDNPVRAIDVFVDEFDLAKLSFGGVDPEATGRPAYHPATLLKIYVYGYLNRVQSSRRLERECQRNIELVWLTGRLIPDFKTIADFRKDNGEAIRKACREFVALCRRLELFSEGSAAIDGSKFPHPHSMVRIIVDWPRHCSLDQRMLRRLKPRSSSKGVRASQWVGRCAWRSRSR